MFRGTAAVRVARSLLLLLLGVADEAAAAASFSFGGGGRLPATPTGQEPPPRRPAVAFAPSVAGRTMTSTTATATALFSKLNYGGGIPTRRGDGSDRTASEASKTASTTPSAAAPTTVNGMLQEEESTGGDSSSPVLDVSAQTEPPAAPAAAAGGQDVQQQQQPSAAADEEPMPSFMKGAPSVVRGGEKDEDGYTTPDYSHLDEIQRLFMVDLMSSHDDKVLQALGRVADFCAGEQMTYEALDEASGPFAIVRCMNKWYNHAAIQAECCVVLSAGSFNYQTSFKDSAVKLGGLEATLLAMKNFPDDEKIQDEGCLALVILAYDSEPYTARLISQLDAAEVVVAAMRNFPDNVSIQRRGCRMLERATQFEEFREDFHRPVLDAGGLAVLTEAIGRHEDNDDVRTQGASALENLCRALKNRRPGSGESYIVQPAVVKDEYDGADTGREIPMPPPGVAKPAPYVWTGR